MNNRAEYWIGRACHARSGNNKDRSDEYLKEARRIAYSQRGEVSAMVYRHDNYGKMMYYLGKGI